MFNKLVSHLGHKKAAALLCIIIAVILTAVNIIAALLPSHISKLDMTGYGMYTLSEDTISAVKAIDTDVELYIMMYSDQSNETMMTVLERYAGINKHIQVKKLDMKNDASFIKQYSANPEAGSIIVKNGERAVYIPYFYLFYFSQTAITNAINYYNYYYQQGGFNGSFNEFLNAYGVYMGIYDGYQYEDRITSAIQYVTSDNVKNVYMLTGHKEETLSNDVLMRLMESGIAIKTLSLTEQDIPADCDGILLLPNADITEAERAKLTEYTSKGGKVLIGTMYGTEYTELYKFTELFGLTSTKGYLCDDDTDHCLEDYPLMITPDVNGETYTSAVSGKDVFVVIGGTQAISKTETTPNGVTITPILTTSEKAYVKEDISTGDYEFDSEKDVRKQYYAAASALNSAGGGIVWIGSSSVLFDDYDYYCGFGNKLFFMQALKATSGFAESISIAPAMVDSGTINTTPTIVYVFLSIVTIVPLGLTVYGVIRYRRRRYA